MVIWKKAGNIRLEDNKILEESRNLLQTKCPLLHEYGAEIIK
jgi:hypothetical protein